MPSLKTISKVRQLLAATTKLRRYEVEWVIMDNRLMRWINVARAESVNALAFPVEGHQFELRASRTDDLPN